VAHIYDLANQLSALLGAIEAPSIENDVRLAFLEAGKILVQLFAPMMPHLGEECWAQLGGDRLVAETPWPIVDRSLVVEDMVTLPVQVNGKKRAELTISRDASQADVEAAVMAVEAVQRACEGRTPKKIIVIPQRIINVVV
jgi:leucyl-tRNA synthetase